MKATFLSKKTKQRLLAAIWAGTVGAFAVAPAAYALPTDPTHDGAVSITTSGRNMDIASTELNNVIEWKDFSIAQGETVAFDPHNYPNQVTGGEMSEIWGTLRGAGAIYLINPNGILFGAGSVVDVGSLYASTRTLSEADIAAFKGGNAITPLADNSLTGDIINMGDLTATKNITLEGNNIIFAGTDSGIEKLPSEADTSVRLVVAKNGSVQVGTVTCDETAGYSIDVGTHQSGSINKTTAFNLVRNKAELQGMDAEGNYMLMGDIEAGGGFTPIENL